MSAPTIKLKANELPPYVVSSKFRDLFPPHQLGMCPDCGRPAQVSYYQYFSRNVVVYGCPACGIVEGPCPPLSC
jgi:hypothetical protein